MTERPILFSAPMVLAILTGRKTQTRRLVKPAPDWEMPEPMSSTTVEGWQGPIDRSTWSDCADPEMDVRRCPYGGPGDGLWVKETWRPRAAQQDWDLDVRYAADGAERTIKDGEFGERDWSMPKAAATGNVSPLFMPRWASRLELLISDARVERLNACSEADAIAEGLIRDPVLDAWTAIDKPAWPRFHDPVRAYAGLWNEINGAGSWQANPWVWVITFERQKVL